MWDRLSFTMITGTALSKAHSHSSLPARHQAVPPLREARGGAAAGGPQRPVRPHGLPNRQDALLVCPCQLSLQPNTFGSCSPGGTLLPRCEVLRLRTVQGVRPRQVQRGEEVPDAKQLSVSGEVGGAIVTG